MEGIVGRDQNATLLRNFRKRRADFRIQSLEFCPVCIQICANLLLVRGNLLNQRLGRLIASLLVELYIEPKVRIRSICRKPHAAVRRQNIILRKRCRDRMAVDRLQEFRHMSLKVETVIEHQLRILKLLPVLRLCLIAVRILARRYDQRNISIIARKLFRHILQEGRRNRHLEFPALRRLTLLPASAKCQQREKRNAELPQLSLNHLYTVHNSFLRPVID